MHTTAKKTILDTFFQASYRSLFENYLDNGDVAEREIAPNTVLRLAPDGDKIDVIYHGTTLARFAGAACTLSTGGFISTTTKEKLNTVIRGHGEVLSVKGAWTLFLIKKSAWEDQWVNARETVQTRFYDDIRFDVNSHEVYSEAPSYSPESYIKLLEIYRKLGGKGHEMTIDEVGIVDGDRFDTMLRGVVDKFVSGITADTVREAGQYCTTCDNDNWRVQESLNTGVIGATAEQKIEVVRAKDEYHRQFDDKHLWQHIEQNKPDYELCYTSCLVYSTLNMEYFDDHLRLRPEMVRKAVRKYLIRRLQKGITTVK